MDTVRYVFAVMVVIFLPPALLWWYVVHPFVSFWRRIGAAGTITILSVAAIGAAAGLFLIRDRLVGTDLGLHWPALAAAAVLFAASAYIALRRRKHLTHRILAGVPELTADGESDTLLTEGIYGEIRHPRYVEIALGTMAYALLANYTGAYVVALATLPALHGIVVLEERELADRFGQRFEEYRRRVPRYIPRGWMPR